MKTLLKWALGLCLVSSTCCCWGLVWSNWDGLGARPGPETAPTPAAPTTDLGVVLLPPQTPPEAARHYGWRVETLRPAEHTLAFGLGASLEQHYALGLKDYATRLHYRPLAGDRFSFRAPPGCERLPMACIYDELMRSNRAPVQALGARFVARVRSGRLTAPQAADLIVSYVQGIRYQVPHEQPFGVLPPALVPAQDRGDCDSKALLAAMLLRQVGIDAVVLSSERLGHAALGVGLPGPGTHFELDGRRYRYAEVTAAGWPIGMVPPRYALPRLWTVLPVAPDASPLGPPVGDSGPEASERPAP